VPHEPACYSTAAGLEWQKLKKRLKNRAVCMAEIDEKRGLTMA